jgi:hypothetical protein
MLLIRVMGLIQDKKVDLVHLYVPVHEQVIEFSGYEDKDVVVSELLDPVFILINFLVVFPA